MTAYPYENKYRYLPQQQSKKITPDQTLKSSRGLFSYPALSSLHHHHLPHRMIRRRTQLVVQQSRSGQLAPL